MAISLEPLDGFSTFFLPERAPSMGSSQAKRGPLMGGAVPQNHPLGRHTCNNLKYGCTPSPLPGCRSISTNITKSCNIQSGAPRRRGLSHRNDVGCAADTAEKRRVQVLDGGKKGTHWRVLGQNSTPVKGANNYQNISPKVGFYE